VVDGAWDLVARLPTTHDELIRVIRIFQWAITRRVTDFKEIESRVQAEVPRAVALLAVLRDPALGSILTALGILVAILLARYEQAPQPPPPPPVQVNAAATAALPRTVRDGKSAPVESAHSTTHAEALWVDVDTTRARIAHLSDDKKKQIDRRIAAKGDVA
jgi:hypothetical protein